MPKVPMIANKSFLYGTRRLQAEEAFYAKNAAIAGILNDLTKQARYGRTPGKVAAPPADVADKIEAAVLPPAIQAEEPAKPKTRRPYRRRAKKS